MEGIRNYEAFVIAAIALNITPGSDSIFILSRSIAQGRKAGIISALGIGTGALTHTLLAGLGLSVIVAKSILVFNVIKYAGIAYLIYVGMKMILGQNGLALPDDKSRQSGLIVIYRDAYLTNLLNPKITLFFLAFLPQFIDPADQGNAMPFIILGLTFSATGTIWCILLAYFADKVFVRFRKNQKSFGVINKCCGAILVSLGLFTCFSN
ncbi:MAG TPA: LysE family translocator [Flavitalea sp.]|nr:LysE family translocator [Flavitalea sp.]